MPARTGRPSSPRQRDRNSNRITCPGRAQGGPAGGGGSGGGWWKRSREVPGSSQRWGGAVSGGSASQCWREPGKAWPVSPWEGHGQHGWEVRWAKRATRLGAGRRRTRARARGRHRSGPAARSLGPTAAGGHVPRPPRIESGAGFGWGGGLAQVGEDDWQRWGAGDEGDDAHLAAA